MIKNYLKTKAQIERLFKDKKIDREKSDKKINEVGWDFRDKIHELERQKYDALEKLQKESKKIQDDYDTRLKPLIEFTDKIERIFKFIDIYVDNIFLFLTPDKDLPLIMHDLEDHNDKEEFNRRLRNMPKKYLDPIEEYEYSSHDENGNYIGHNNRKILLTPIDVLMDHDMVKMNIYIIKNKKPVNQYSLKKTLKSAFHEIHLNSTLNRELLKDAPTKTDLIKWYNNHKEIIRKENTEPFLSLIQEYENAINLFQKHDWQYAYMLWKKHYYEYSYSHGTETKEYKKILQEIKRLESKICINVSMYNTITV